MKLAAIALLQTACIVGTASLGTSTAVSASDRVDESHVRFAGMAGVGTGYLGEKGGFGVGFAADRIPPGHNHAGAGPWGLVTVRAAPHVQVFGRFTYTQAFDESTTKCTPEICGKQYGFAIGAHLVDVTHASRVELDGNEEDAPLVAGAGVALAYHRVDLNGDIGHYIGIEISILMGGAMTTSGSH